MDTFITGYIKGALEIGFKIISFWFTLWLIPFSATIDWFHERISPLITPIFNYFYENRGKLFKLILYSIFLITVASILSLFTFSLIYSTKVPKVTTESSLYFDFSIPKKHQISASADLSAELQKNKLYDIFLELELPESPKNLDLGNFMVCMVINNNDKWNPNRIHSNCKPAMLKYTSPTLKNIKSYVNTVPYLLGLYEEKQIISLPMIENLLSTRYYHTISIEVTVMSSDIQIYSSSIKIMANLSGLEYYLHYYPIISFIIGYISLFIFYLTALLFSVTSVFLYRYFKTHQFESDVVQEIVEQQQQQQQHSDLSENEEQEREFSFSQVIGDEEPSSSSFQKRKHFAWEVNGEASPNKFTFSSNAVNNDNNNNNNNNNNSNDEKDDKISEILKSEQKKYEQQQQEQKEQQETEILTEVIEENNNALNLEREIISPQPILDDLSSSSSTLSTFSFDEEGSDSDEDLMVSKNLIRKRK